MRIIPGLRMAPGQELGSREAIVLLLVRLLEAPFNLASDTSRDGVAPASLDSFCQGLTNFTVKKIHPLEHL
ncbi:hypothetical protein DUI87_06901 [Hirundo rustica rustica]|uniref:Uncharacterized protein n=1 Tax=Hirundo rustica rustica TaxID=333673 RepID=A0A3M0KNC0_HIRRU|nr:hypothetical protein DUI87_06901 [Hirundo rustica rustica]